MKVPPYLDALDTERVDARWRSSQIGMSHVDLLECPACKAPLASRHTEPLQRWKCGSYMALVKGGQRLMYRTWACVQLQALRAFIKEIRA